MSERNDLDINETRAMLIALLQDMPLPPPPAITGVAEMDTHDKLFMLATCCAKFIEETIWIQSTANRIRAMEGLNAILQEMRRHIMAKSDGKF